MLAAAVVLDLSLAHARATGVVPVKPAADCNSPAPAAAAPPAASPDAAAPPGMLAAFGSCGDGGSTPAPSPIRK